jgi:glyoxylase I family protein
VADDTFDEDRTGLDQLAFVVNGRDDLDSAATDLDDLGIAHEPVNDYRPAYILEFRDPDNIALEPSVPK